jgi:hypothetical protein
VYEAAGGFCYGFSARGTKELILVFLPVPYLTRSSEGFFTCEYIRHSGNFILEIPSVRYINIFFLFVSGFVKCYCRCFFLF